MNEIRGWVATGRRAVRVARQHLPARERSVGMVLGLGALLGTALLTPYHPVSAPQPGIPLERPAPGFRWGDRWAKPDGDFRGFRSHRDGWRAEREAARTRPGGHVQVVPAAPEPPAPPAAPAVQPVQPVQPAQPVQP